MHGDGGDRYGCQRKAEEDVERNYDERQEAVENGRFEPRRSGLLAKWTSCSCETSAPTLISGLIV